MSREGTRFDDSLWTRVAIADIEDEGKFYECAIYEHKTGGGHCIYFGADEYEGVGEDSSCDTYSFRDGALRDSDGSLLLTRLRIRARCSC